MIGQKAISAKLDNEVLRLIDAEASVSGRKRNRLLNDAVLHYSKYLDDERRRKAGGRSGAARGTNRAEEIGKYILDNLTTGEHENIQFTARACGTTEEHLMLLLISRGLEEFKRRPFSYL